MANLAASDSHGKWLLYMVVNIGNFLLFLCPVEVDSPIYFPPPSPGDSGVMLAPLTSASRAKPVLCCSLSPL